MAVILKESLLDLLQETKRKFDLNNLEILELFRF